MLRAMLTVMLAVLAKLSLAGPPSWLPLRLSLARYHQAPLLCDALCTADQTLAAAAPLYLVFLSLHLFCR